MTDRIKKEECVRRLAANIQTEETSAAAWVDGIIETLSERFQAGKSVILPGLGGFQVRPEPESWVFPFKPGQQ